MCIRDRTKSSCNVHEIVNVTFDILEKYLHTFSITLIKDLSAKVDSIEISANEFEFILTSMIQNSKDAISSSKRNIGPVSYTHLDVYKRQ